MAVNRKIRRRIVISGIIVGAVMLVLTARLYYLQVVVADEISEKARRQYTATVNVPAVRGSIYCMRGCDPVLLASTVYAPSLAANPRDISDREALADTLAGILDTDRDEIYRKLRRTEITDARGTRPNYYVLLAPRITAKQADEIRALKNAALTIDEHPVRRYIRGDYLSAVLGFVGKDDDGFYNKGLAGLELQYDAILRGTPGQYFYVADARRQKRRQLDAGGLAPRKGGSIFLTIHPEIQTCVENALVDIVERWQPQSAMAIVMDPDTGDILAMAVLPSYDPNNLAASEAEERRNRAVVDLYEPGSVMKPLIASALLSENVDGVDKGVETQIKCYGPVAGRNIGGHSNDGWSSIRDVVVYSSNVGAARMGVMLNQHRGGALKPWMIRYGFDDRPGLGFPGERRGGISQRNRWSDSTSASVSFGHEINLTPLHIARAYCAIANGGRLVTPRLVRGAIDADGNVTEFAPEPGQPILSPEVCAVMRGILGEVVSRGTAKRAGLDDNMGGKTGTAEKVVDGRYSSAHNYASFVGMAPIDNPRIIVLISVDDPVGASSGGAVAAPAAGDVLRRALAILAAEDMRAPEDKSLKTAAEALKP